VAIAAVTRHQDRIGAHLDLAAMLYAQERRAAQTSAEAALTAVEGQVTRYLNRASVGHHHLGIRASTSAVAVHKKSKSQS
jgi:hypothetical protein